MKTDPTIGSKRKILLAEDEPALQKVLIKQLEAKGYEVLFADNGEAALEIARRSFVDLALLDVILPGMNGFEVCEEIKRDIKLASIPVIFLTARGSQEDILHGFEVGGVDYITKPFRTAELLARVKAHVDLHHLRRILSLCSYCGKIHNKKEEKWEDIVTYLQKIMSADLSHGICPSCYEKVRDEWGVEKKVREE